MNQCRISNGYLRRRFIATPKIKSTRPTTDIVKQSLFNVLIHRFHIDFTDFFVIDLFAGSGALGIEAISCGCKNALFVDSNLKAVNCIKNNLNNLDIAMFATVICQKAESILDQLFLKLGQNFQDVLIFMDPPYLEKILLKEQILRFFNLFKNKRLLIVAESEGTFDIDALNCHEATRHGDTVVFILSNKK